MARKTTTSSEVKNRYNSKTYKRFTVSVKKEIAEKFENKLKSDGIEHYSGIFHDAIDNYLNDTAGIQPDELEKALSKYGVDERIAKKILNELK